jgi:hypothetical protein
VSRLADNDSDANDIRRMNLIMMVDRLYFVDEYFD